MKTMGNDVAVSEAFREAQNKEYNFRIFAKRENNQNGDGTRIGLQVTRVEKIDYAKDSRSLINLIDEFSQLSYKN